MLGDSRRRKEGYTKGGGRKEKKSATSRDKLRKQFISIAWEGL